MDWRTPWRSLRRALATRWGSPGRFFALVGTELAVVAAAAGAVYVLLGDDPAGRILGLEDDAAGAGADRAGAGADGLGAFDLDRDGRPDGIMGPSFRAAEDDIQDLLDPGAQDRDGDGRADAGQTGTWPTAPRDDGGKASATSTTTRTSTTGQTRTTTVTTTTTSTTTTGPPPDDGEDDPLIDVGEVPASDDILPDDDDVPDPDLDLGDPDLELDGDGPGGLD